MEIIVFEKDTYWKLQAELFRLFREQMKDLQKPQDDWINTAEAKKLLGIRSNSKMQQLRDNMAIRYSKHGKKLIQYSKSSILDYLNKNVPKY